MGILPLLIEDEYTNLIIKLRRNVIAKFDRALKNIFSSLK